MRPRDPCEVIVYDALKSAGFNFTTERQNPSQRLDFQIPSMNLLIEVKQFHTPRIAHQLEGYENVILIQGKHAAKMFSELINRHVGDAADVRL